MKVMQRDRNKSCMALHGVVRGASALMALDDVGVSCCVMETHPPDEHPPPHAGKLLWGNSLPAC